MNSLGILGRETCNSIRLKALTLTAFIFSLVLLPGCAGGTRAVNSNGNVGSGPAAASIIGTIAVGTAPSAVAVDSTNNKIFVTDFGTTPTGIQGCSPSGSNLTAIDGATQSTTSVGFRFPQQTPMNPFAMTLNPANQALYVITWEYWSGIKLNGNCGLFGVNVEVFDAASLGQTANYQDKGGTGIAVNPTNGNIYVARGGGNVIVLDTSGNLLATVPVGAGPSGMAVNATTNKVYVTNTGSGDISVIDAASNSVVATITDPSAAAPTAIAANPTTNTIYVANSQSNNITVIDGATDSVTATIPVGTAPSGVDVDPQTNFIYVANTGNSQTGDPGNITVIDGAKHTKQMLSDANAKNPSAIAVNTVTNEAYVTNSGSNNVTVIKGTHE